MTQPQSIVKVAKETHRAISSAQVVTSIGSVVKELVDNSIDAGASAIDVTFIESGLVQLSVTDNGSGIALDDEATVSTLVVDRATSKSDAYINPLLNATHPPAQSQQADQVGDETNSITLGFRGEALHSIATLASLSITTRTATMPHPLTVEYRLGGHAVAARRAATGFPHQTGTRIAVTDLFQRIPVRRKELETKIKLQFTAAVNIVKQLAIAHPDIRFHVSCSPSAVAGQSAKPASVVFATRGSGDFSTTIAEVYGGKFASQLMTFRCRAEGFDILALLSRIGDGRASADMQFFALDGRPVDLPKLATAVNECYTATHPSASIRFPVIFMSLTTARESDGDLYDPNVAPDKRSAIFNDEVGLINAVRRDLLNFLSGALSTTSVGGVDKMVERSSSAQLGLLLSDSQRQLSSMAVPRAAAVVAVGTTARTEPQPASLDADDNNVQQDTPTINSTRENVSRRNTASDRANKRELLRELIPDLAKDTESDDEESSSDEDSFLVSSSTTSSEEGDEVPPDNDDVERDGVEVGPSLKERKEANQGSPPRFAHQRLNLSVLHVGAGGTPLGTLQTSLSGHTPNVVSDQDLTPSSRPERMQSPVPNETDRRVAAAHPPAPRPAAVPHIDVQLDLDRNTFAALPAVAAAQLPLAFQTQTPANKGGKDTLGRKRGQKATWSGLGAATAERELQANFTKHDFERMEVAGQFNDGFIIATVDNQVFVLDQHASDEKHTFEMLRAAYVPKAQPLLAPIRVVAEEPEIEAAYRHQAELARHGFRLHEPVPNTIPDALYVSAIPILVYDPVKADDVLELTSQLRRYGRIDNPLRAVWHSTATKACRTSIMIGKALDMPTMKRIVSNMSSMDHPWNCPHGRPTMRFVTDLSKHEAALFDPVCMQAAPDLGPLVKRHRAEDVDVDFDNKDDSVMDAE